MLSSLDHYVLCVKWNLYVVIYVFLTLMLSMYVEMSSNVHYLYVVIMCFEMFYMIS